MSYLPVVIGALGLTGLYVWKKQNDAKGAQHVPLGQSGTPLGQLAQQAAYTNAPVSQSMSVTDIQQTLNALGANPALKVDGIDGAKTTAAIKSFQAQANLTADGVVGPQTASALRIAAGQAGSSAGSGVTAGNFFQLEEGAEPVHDGVAGNFFHLDEYCGHPWAHSNTTFDPETSVHVGADWGQPDDGSGWDAPCISEVMNDPVQRSILEYRQQMGWVMPGEVIVSGYADEDEGCEAVGAASSSSSAGTHRRHHRHPQSPADVTDQDIAQAYVGQGWSAPDINEALQDPVQRAQMAANTYGMMAAPAYGTMAMGGGPPNLVYQDPAQAAMMGQSMSSNPYGLGGPQGLSYQNVATAPAYVPQPYQYAQPYQQERYYGRGRW